MTLLIDNYDSFSYNLYQLIGAMDPAITVLRNDECTVDELRDRHPDRIILSPGPGRPEQAGILLDVVQTLGKTIPLLGVCLGHQAICAAFGAKIVHAKKLMHGKQSMAVLDQNCPLFSGCPAQIPVARYHSLAVDDQTLPSELQVTARTADGETMAVRHQTFPIYGVQFHPESILTPNGKQILENFLKENPQ